MRRDWTLALLRLALACLTVGCLAGVCTCDFVNFDDPLYVTDNPHVQQGLTASSLAWAWTDFHRGMYAPLTRTSLLLDYQLHGLNPHGYHLTNLLLHLVNVLVLFEVLRSMTGARWRCFLVAACFAIHPLHVESVAWITERKDVLSTLFGLLALAAWVRYTRWGGLPRILLVLASFAASLLSKPMWVTFPFVLLLLDRWPLRRHETIPWSRLCLEKVPLLLLALAACAVTATVHNEIGARACLGDLALKYRLANAAVSCVAYLGQTAWPVGLAAYYPHPLESLPLWKFAGSAALLLLATVLVIRQHRRKPELLVGWLWFLGTLTPVLGLVSMGGYARADRYTYVPHIGLFVGLVYGMDAGWFSSSRRRLMAVVSAGAMLAALGVLTWKQTLTWRNSWTLWEHALRVTRGNYMAHSQLGILLAEEEAVSEAIEHYEVALQLIPDYKPALLNLAMIRVEQEQFAMAEPLLRRAVSVVPEDSHLHFLLGFSLEKLNRWPEAEVNLCEAVRLDPDSADGHLELGAVLEHQHRLSEAELHFQRALRLEPSSASGHCRLGILCEHTGRSEEATRHLREALRLDPHLGVAHAHLGVQCEQQGELDEAAQHLHAALRQAPNDSEAHCNLGVVLERQGKLVQAEGELREAIRLAPALAEAHVNLGIVLERQGKRDRATACFREAVGIAPAFVEARCALAAALAEQGQLTTAAREFGEAVRLDAQWPMRTMEKAWRLAVHPDARMRNGPESLRLARQVALVAGGLDAVCLDVLAAAQAENGDYEKAAQNAQRALELVKRNIPPSTLSVGGWAEVGRRIASRLDLYHHGRPYREMPR
jgi:Flp pilus assembly protein TadD